MNTAIKLLCTVERSNDFRYEKGAPRCRPQGAIERSIGFRGRGQVESGIDIDCFRARTVQSSYQFCERAPPLRIARIGQVLAGADVNNVSRSGGLPSARLGNPNQLVDRLHQRQ
ncbi:hypothetical protein AAW00_06990 [Aurantiacibacter luteus]|uniref:Uncharacterized protein n=1 Tax=Aurantiacibacter luteus TaxID=1581420 RepID=A0A0G9MTE2_9SPHN|nr:hypothetical protein AAW00_06990 [Aurantiacibacter luteus]